MAEPIKPKLIEDARKQPANELRQKRAQIVSNWEKKVQRVLPATRKRAEPALIDSVPQFIDRLIDALAQSSSERELAFKTSLVAAQHGEQRADLPEFDLDQVLVEYRILREVIFDVLREGGLLTESAAGSIEDSIQSGMGASAIEFLKIRMIREAQARREAENANRSLTGLQEVTAGALAKTTSFQNLLYELLHRVKKVFQADTVVILLIDEKKENLVVTAAYGLEDEVKQELKIPYGKGIAGRIFEQGQGMIFNDLEHTPIYSPLLKSKNLKSLMGAPLLTSRDKVGVIHVGSLEKREFTSEELRLLQMIGDRIVTAIENARLYEQRKKDIEMLEAESSLRKRILSILTHDIRNPLTAAQMSAKLLLRPAHPPEVVRRLAQRIVNSLGRSDQLIQDLLDINKVIAREPIELEREFIDIFEVFMESFGRSTSASEDRFEIEGNPKQVGHWSKRHLSRIADACLNIAIRYGTHETPIVVTISSTDQDTRIRVHFYGNVAEPHDLTDVLCNQDLWLSVERESRLSLEWTLISSFSEAMGGRASLSRQQEGETEIHISLPRGLRDELKSNKSRDLSPEG